MNRQTLVNQIKKKKSYLCVGLDTDIKKIPSSLLSEKDPVYEFNRHIIDATSDYCVAYKANIAFYEALGNRGWESLFKTVQYIPKDKFVIADAKRGDIGNTSELYARTFFSSMEFDAVTLSPYLGYDAIDPFLEYDDKWVIVLAVTTNDSSKDFQTLEIKEENLLLYEKVILKSREWAGSDRLMFVVGATKADLIKNIRKLAPDNFFLIPGVGMQGGDLEMISEYGLIPDGGLLVNSSRSILYASSDNDFAYQAGKNAAALQKEMKGYLDKYVFTNE